MNACNIDSYLFLLISIITAGGSDLSGVFRTLQNNRSFVELWKCKSNHYIHVYIEEFICFISLKKYPKLKPN